MISVSTRPVDKNYKAWEHYQFRTVEPKSLQDFMLIIFSEVWSPIIFTNGRRKKNNFFSCAYAGLDIDDGLTIDQAVDKLQARNLNHIIGTTKSHQIIKNEGTTAEKPACDRYRIIIPFTTVITSVRQYEATMNQISSDFESDTAAKLASQFFFPCIRIARIATDGLKLTPEPEPPERKEIDLSRQINVNRYQRTGSYPQWCQEFLEQGNHPQGRNKRSYAVARKFHELGIPENETLQLLEDALSHHADFKKLGITKTVRSAYRN